MSAVSATGYQQFAAEGFLSARFSTDKDLTTVQLQKREGNQDYWITLNLRQPLNQNNLQAFLNQQATKEKIEQAVKQFQVFATVYGGKKDLRLEANGSETKFSYKGKKETLKTLNLSEDKYQETWKTETEKYKKKIDQAKAAKKADRVQKFTDKLQKFEALLPKFQPYAKSLPFPKPAQDHTNLPPIGVSQVAPAPVSS